MRGLTVGPSFGRPTVLAPAHADFIFQLKGSDRRRGSQGRVFATGKRGDTPGSFEQPRFPKTLKLQL
jgi:hypothetical protein